ncbi:conserved hypothetical protein [Neospora caninum Liverpool]|uniref:Uncharacterized protein n=1 Tax=Neospora caninum (strain Liverpool) TaxID=572307 RepID=F0VJT7_NEOCL|nr:conserved hypothetical protein [Neospora caninum Liverpool]CBZ53998.1 conserved hypothetical protein [Neospora caninum Liverpool]|eukprot:XP_003884030.1 conserved hypothetical protein [Neospora caninum Liverpool]
MARVKESAPATACAPPPDRTLENLKESSTALQQSNGGTPSAGGACALYPSSPDVKLKSPATDMCGRRLPVDEFTSLTTTADSSTPAAATPTAGVPLLSVASQKNGDQLRERATHVGGRQKCAGNAATRDPVAAPSAGGRLPDVTSAEVHRPKQSQRGGSRFATDPFNHPTAMSLACSSSPLQPLSFEHPDEASSLEGPPRKRVDSLSERTDRSARREPLLVRGRLGAEADCDLGSSSESLDGVAPTGFVHREARNRGNPGVYSGGDSVHRAAEHNGEAVGPAGDCGVSRIGSAESEVEAQRLVKSLIAERDLYKAAFGAANEELEELQGSHRQLQKALGDADRRLLHSKLLLHRQQRRLAAADQGGSAGRRWEAGDSLGNVHERVEWKGEIHNYLGKEESAQNGVDEGQTPAASHSSADVANSRARTRCTRGQGRATSRSSCSKSAGETGSVSGQTRPDTVEARFGGVTRRDLSKTREILSSHRACAPEYILSPAVQSSNDSQLGERTIEVFRAGKPRPSSLLVSKLPEEREVGCPASEESVEPARLPCSSYGGMKETTDDGRPGNNGCLPSLGETAICNGRGGRSYSGHTAGQASGEARDVMEKSRRSVETAPRFREGFENERTASAVCGGTEGQSIFAASAFAATGHQAAAGSRTRQRSGGYRSPGGEGASPALRSVSCDGFYGLNAGLGDNSKTPEDLCHSHSVLPPPESVQDREGQDEDKASLPSLLLYEAPETARNNGDKKNCLQGNSDTLRKSIVDSYFWLQKLSTSISAGEYPSVELLVRGVEEQQQLMRVAQTMEEEREQYVDAVANLHAELRSVRDEACIYLLAHQQQATDLQQEADDAHAAADFWLQSHLRFMRKWQQIGYGALIYLPAAPIISDEDRWRHEQLFQTDARRLMIAGDCEIDPLEVPEAPGGQPVGDPYACRESQSLRAVDAICAAQIILQDEQEAGNGEAQASEAAEDLSWAMPDDFVRLPGVDRDPKKVKSECFQKAGSKRSESFFQAWRPRRYGFHDETQ